jgi:drug/metabolite transporter (DMT)-like permease
LINTVDKVTYMNSVVLILLSCLVTVVGQVLFKLGANEFAEVEFSLSALPGLLWQMLTNPKIIVGFFMFGLGAVLWLFALARTELSYAAPLAGVTYPLLLIAGVLVFREPVTVVKVAGTLLVAAGVVLVSWR